MRISIGLPSTIPSTPGALILDWARKADARPFSSLSLLDRLVYPNYDSLIGPAPAQAGGPETLIGGYSPQSFQRAARWGVGYMAGGSPPDSARQGYEAVAAAWKAAGRPGKPRFVTATYFALGEDAATRGAA